MANLDLIKDFARASFTTSLWTPGAPVAPGRQPTDAEITDWQASLGAAYTMGLSGFLTTVAGRLGSIFSSSEYTSLARTDDQFIDDLYLTYFGRASDSSGHAFWLANLLTNDRPTVIAAFGESLEFVKRISREFDITDPADSGFEQLLEIGSFGLSEQIEFRVLSFDLGDGYEDSAIIGSTEGMLSWSLKWNVLPGFISQNGTGPLSAQSRADYLWDFFCRQMSQGNKSFYLISPRSGKMYLAAFADTKLSYELMMTKLYTTGVNLKQRREAGVKVGSG